MGQLHQRFVLGIVLGAGTLVCIRARPGPITQKDLTGVEHSSMQYAEFTVLIERGWTTNEVAHDKFFIPALATIGAFVIVVLFCFYMLGWCCNPERGENPPEGQRLSQMGLDTKFNAEQHRTSSVQNDTGVGQSGSPGARQSNLQRKPPPQFHSNGSRTPPPGIPRGMTQAFYVQDHESRPEDAQFAPDASSMAPMSFTSANLPVSNENRGFLRDKPRESILSSGQSTTQIGSEHESQQHADGYPAADYGYGSKGAPPAPGFAKRPPGLSRVPLYQDYRHADTNEGAGQAYGTQENWNHGQGRINEEPYQNEPSSTYVHGTARNPSYMRGPSQTEGR